MGVKLVSASGGSVELVAPATATNYTATMPANTGTVITTASTFAGTGPAFSAYLSTNQSVSSTVLTKVQLNSEAFDTNNNFDPVTNYRFTPTVAGYYQFSYSVYSYNAMTAMSTRLAKNGTVVAWAESVGGGSYSAAATGSALIYMNGSTDYIELYCAITGTSPAFFGRSDLTYLQGVLVRAA